MKITADFTRITGKVKPMHGVGQPPLTGGSPAMFHYLGEAGIPYSRLHDVGGWMGGGLYVDIPNLFRDFDADETDPASYDFAFTDRFIGWLMQQRCEPFFRLGVTIENSHMLKSYRIFPPKDYEKWARICEQVVRHYNEGWADGFHYNIKYWEIWNEPDDCWKTETSAMWKGTKEDYFRLYEVTANHLKKCFGDSIKVGGYASCGFYALDSDPECNGMNGRKAEKFEEFFIEFFRDFLLYISSEEHKAPLDYFSWHVYGDVKLAKKHAAYCRKMLNRFGFGHVEDILNEWNACFEAKKRGTPYAAANSLAMMLGMQKETTGMLCYYDARLGPSNYGGMFNPDTWEPYLNYYGFKAFNTAYRLKNEVENASDDPAIYTLAAAGEGKAVLLVSNLHDHEVTIDLELTGVDLHNAKLIRIDGEHRYTETEESLAGGRLTMPAWSGVKIRF